MKKIFSAPVVCAFVGATFLAACGDEEPSKNDGTGGGTTGGTSTGGTTAGGTAGVSTGGTPTGGTSGASTGGVAGTPAAGAAGTPGGAGGAGAGGAGAGGAGAGGAGAGGGGAGGASPVAPRLISTFDTAGSLTVKNMGTWAAGTYMPVLDSVVSRNMTEGFSCAGSAQLVVPFVAYGAQQDIQINFSPLQNWTGYRTLHARVKVLMPSTGNLNHLNGIQLAVNSTTMYNTFKGHFYTPGTFMDFGWHDLDLDLTTANPALVFAEVIQVQVQVQAQAMAPAMGPAAPVSTTILVDDVWVD